MSNRCGYSLLEVLVALSIFGAGVLTSMGLQQRLLQTTESAYWKSQATFIAQDLIDRMDLNPTVRSIYAAVNQASASTNTHACTRAWCSAEALARQDVVDIYNELQNQLPTPRIRLQDCMDGRCVRISWLNTPLDNCESTDGWLPTCIELIFKS